jgi:hypothetical protein
MRIACLGWGSLVWDPRTLPIRREWFTDGPFVPVEFTRKSSDGRMTLVVDPRATPLRVLWAQMVAVDVPVAAKALCNREGITRESCSSGIGSWKTGGPAPGNISGLSAWAEARDLDAVIWTALGPKFERTDRSPSADEVIAYLRGLRGPVRDHAKQYIERAPRQIDTDYRRQIEAALGWSYSAGLSA